jgi:rare lipoprotein A (peptidoglycan hydrolase)
MAAINFLKKTACWTAVFLCLLSISRAVVLLGGQSARTIQSGEVKIISRDAMDFSRILFISPSAAHPEKIEGVTPVQAPRPTPPNLGVKVTAGWYGLRHHKNLTANGRRFNMYKNTLAHKTLPLGTKVRLVTLDNKKSAVGVVNDRGPFTKGRDLDVSYLMAKQLGFVGKGVAKLYISTLEGNEGNEVGSGQGF